MSVIAAPLSPQSAPSVQDALTFASRKTGMDFSYLLDTAQRESGLNTQAKSKSSSATGLFQFIEQTWLSTLKAHGEQHGFGEEAAAIETSENGKLRVADPAQREAILALRKDAKASALMAAELAKDSRDSLQKTLGRKVNSEELYLAHFFGPRQASNFIKGHEQNPNAAAADVFGPAALANRGVFYDGAGHARSFADVKAHLVKLHGGSNSAPVEDLSPIDDPELDFAWTTTAERTPSITRSWMTGHPAMRLTPQILAILSSLDPLPDSRAGKKGYGQVLSSGRGR